MLAVSLIAAHYLGLVSINPGEEMPGAPPASHGLGSASTWTGGIKLTRSVAH